MERMTIHRALSELKTIESRIDKKIGSIEPVAVFQKNQLIHGYKNQEVFKEEAISNYQSIVDLINRYDKIKCAIVRSNAMTDVRLNDDTVMSVADLINYKNVIDQKKRFRDILSRSFYNCTSVLEQKNKVVEENALRLATTVLGKESVKPKDSDVDPIIKPYMEKNTWHLLDPLGIEDELRSLDENIDYFIGNVDALLSESNATTFIEI